MKHFPVSDQEADLPETAQRPTLKDLRRQVDESKQQIDSLVGAMASTVVDLTRKRPVAVAFGGAGLALALWFLIKKSRTVAPAQQGTVPPRLTNYASFRPAGAYTDSHAGLLADDRPAPPRPQPADIRREKREPTNRLPASPGARPQRTSVPRQPTPAN